MDAALFGDGQRVVEQIHQHGFAPANPAPHIHPAWRRRGLAANQPPDQAGSRRGCFQLLLQQGKPSGRRRLLGIGAQFAGGNQRGIAGNQFAHATSGSASPVGPDWREKRLLLMAGI